MTDPHDAQSLKTEAVSASGRTWTAGDYLTHRFNPELGIGCVATLDGRALIVEFPHSNTKLRLAANTDALIPVDLAPGRPVRLEFPILSLHPGLRPRCVAVLACP